MKKKILFTSKYGLDEVNSAGGQVLRVDSTIKAISNYADIDVYFRVFNYSDTKFISLPNKTKILKGPSTEKKVKKNFFHFLNWRLNELRNIKKDALDIIKIYKAGNYDALWVSYVSNSYFFLRIIKLFDKKIKVISDTDSVYYKFIQRKAKHVLLYKKIFYYFYSIYFYFIEKSIINISDITTAVSNYDKKIFQKINKKKKIHICRNVISAVKVNKLKPKKDKTFKILLSGTFGKSDTPMNVSTKWFLEKVYPKIKNKIKNHKLIIIGKNSQSFSINFNSRKIFFKGYVKSIKSYFQGCDIAIVPLLYESGTRFKILEAGKFYLPVVSTTLGAEGLEIKNNFNILIADKPDLFSRHIIKLYRNIKARKKLAKNLNHLVKSKYTLSSLKKDIKLIISRI